MISSLEEYIKRVDKFSDISSSNLIEYFSYYLLTFDGKTAIKAKDIENCFTTLNIPMYSNIHRYLSDNSKKKGGTQKFIKSKIGYTLSRSTSSDISSTVSIDIPTIHINNVLRALVPRLSNPSEQMFLEEAIKTFEVEAYRASIIMVWLLTLDHLYEYILSNKLSDFIAALRRMNIQRNMSTKDDFGDLKESQFIEACRGAGIISNDIRKILDIKLGIRNSFAHPSTILLPKSKALEFIEDLIINVLLKY